MATPSDLRVVAIIQARMGSSRLPGKSMADLAGRPLVEHVFRRVSRAQTLTEIVLATTALPTDDCLCLVAKRLGIHSFRGPETDVLKRYLLAAQKFKAHLVVRVCADNPLVAPGEIDRIVRHHIDTGSDYSFNHIPAFGNSYPDGLGAEVINFKVLSTVERLATKKNHREHVTSYIWDHINEFQLATLHAPENISAPDIKLDVDTEYDLTRLRILFGEAPRDPVIWSARSIVKAYRSVIN